MTLEARDLLGRNGLVADHGRGPAHAQRTRHVSGMVPRAQPRGAEPVVVATPVVPPAPVVRRPMNVARTVFHVASGAVALVMVHLLPTRLGLTCAAAAFALVAWSCELVRRRSPEANARIMRVFGPVAHAHEWREVNSATWYATALVLMAAVLPRDAASIGVVVLACADPMAGIVGRRFGRVRFASGRSLEGALAFVVTGALAAYGWSFATGTLADHRLLLALVAGLAGAAIELFIARIDDNFAIPVGTALAVTGAAALLG